MHIIDPKPWENPWANPTDNDYTSTSRTVKRVHVCPVCNGKGTKKARFYDKGAAKGERVKCRSCDGTGILWSDTWEFGSSRSPRPWRGPIWATETTSEPVVTITTRNNNTDEICWSPHPLS